MDFCSWCQTGGAWSFLHKALVLTPGMGPAAGGGRGGVLEVSSFTGDTVAVSLYDFIFELGLGARRAVGEWLAVLTLRVPKTQYIPGWQWHWALRLLVQGVSSTKPSILSQGRHSWQKERWFQCSLYDFSGHVAQTVFWRRLHLVEMCVPGGSGSSRGEAWTHSTPFPGLRSFGSLCGMGAPAQAPPSPAGVGMRPGDPRRPG